MLRLLLLLMMMPTFFFVGRALCVHSADATRLFLHAAACLLRLRPALAWRKNCACAPKGGARWPGARVWLLRAAAARKRGHARAPRLCGTPAP